jgi:hypothetical protein
MRIIIRRCDASIASDALEQQQKQQQLKAKKFPEKQS